MVDLGVTNLWQCNYSIYIFDMKTKRWGSLASSYNDLFWKPIFGSDLIWNKNSLKCLERSLFPQTKISSPTQFNGYRVNNHGGGGFASRSPPLWPPLNPGASVIRDLKMLIFSFNIKDLQKKGWSGSGSATLDMLRDGRTPLWAVWPITEI